MADENKENKLDIDGLTYLWRRMLSYIRANFSLIGSTVMGTTANTITGAIKEIVDKIGDTTMGTTATTITGAIAEHESDISNLNSKTFHEAVVTLSFTSGDAISDFGSDILVVGAYSQDGAYYIQHYFSNNNNKWKFNMFYFSSESGVRLVTNGNYKIVVQYTHR